MIATDPALSRQLVAAFGPKLAGHVELAAAGSGVVLALALGGVWRRLRDLQVAKLAARARLEAQPVSARG